MVRNCINSWYRVLPDYKIMLWDTKRFDVNSTIWTRQAFEAKKYAFVADYIRFYAVYNYGGIYLDSDVEVIRSFNDLLKLPYFVGRDADLKNLGLEIAAFGAEKGTAWVKECLDYYQNRPFIAADGSMEIKALPRFIVDILESHFNIKCIDNISQFSRDPDIICVFPQDWFCAHQIIHRKNNRLRYYVTEKSYCVHQFANSWVVKGRTGFLHKLYFIIRYGSWKERNKAITY